MSPPHGQQSFMNFSNTDQFFRGCCPSGTASSTVGSSQGHKSYQKTWSSLGSSPRESTDHCQESSPAQVSHGLKPSFRNPPALVWVSSMTCRRISAFLCSTMGCARMKENLTSGAWSTSCPSFSPDCSVCRAVPLTQSHSSLLSELFSERSLLSSLRDLIDKIDILSITFFLPHHRGIIIMPDVIGLGQKQVHHGASWHWLC